MNLAAQSLAGTGRITLGSGMAIDDLVDGVCSPGGTTIEGCKVLEEKDFEDTAIKCVDAIMARSAEIGKR